MLRNNNRYLYNRLGKFFLTILAFVYITSSIGATIHLHYCMGKLANWDIGQNISKNCAKCGMKKTDNENNGCCKDEKKFIKNIADQKIDETVFQLTQYFSVLLSIDFIELPVINVCSVIVANNFGHAPPPGSGIAVYIRNCVFLI